MKTRIPLILELADRITADIARRKLQPGESYLTTLETANMLGVSTTAANRAMQVLVKRKILHRRQRKGATIANPPVGDVQSPLQRIHLLVLESYLRTEGVLADGIVIGMHGELPAVQVQFSFLPADDDLRSLNALMSEAMRSTQTEGFVLVRTSLAVQRLVAQSGLPAVVYGALHPSVPSMARIDRDHGQAARLMVNELLGQGFRRIGMLMRDRMLRGDHELFDAGCAAMASAGLDLTALTARFLPPDHDAIRSAVAEVLAASDEPIGFICRSEPLAQGAQAAIDAAASIPGRRGRQTAIVVADAYRKPSDPPPRWPYIRPLLPPEEIGHHIGRMLAQQARQERVHPNREIIAVHLERPNP